jgi:TfoX/Sxy family transcriptional regulator of competence genes
VAFDEQLGEKVRSVVKGQRGLVEKKMFGGLAFLINGNMSVGVHKNELIVRLPPEETDSALKEPGARIFDITGRPMKGWLMIGGAGLKNETALKNWVKRGVSFASALPKKK